MGKPASTLNNKGSYYFSDGNLETVKKTLESLADKGINGFNEMVVYLCINAGKQANPELETTCKNLETTVEEQRLKVEELTGKLAETEASIQPLQQKYDALVIENEKLNTLAKNFIDYVDGLSKKLVPAKEGEEPIAPVQILQAFMEELDELLDRWRYADEKEKFVSPIELIERSYRAAKAMQMDYNNKIAELQKKISTEEPFRLGQDEVVIKILPEVVEKLRKCRKYMKADNRIKTDDPSETVNYCINELLRIYYDHILQH